MVDGTIGVKQSTAPDRLVDNEVLTVGAQTVYRQRTQDPEAIAALGAILAALGDKLAEGGEVALDAATLVALETVTATIANFPVEYPLPATQVQTDALTDVELRATPLQVDGTITVDTITGSVEISNDAGSPVPVSGTVSVNEPVTVDGEVSLAAATLAALENIQAAVTGTVALDAPTLAALENITAAISGTVEVTNDTGNPLPVSGSITISDGSGPVTVDGSVSVTGNVEVVNDVGNPLPVSGTVEVTNDVGNPLPISGSVTISDGSGPVTVDGTVAISNSSIEVSNDVGNPVPVSGSVAISGASTATLTNVTMTGASVVLAASNASRKSLMIFNDSGVVCHVKFGTAASATSFTVKLVDQAHYELPLPIYTGVVEAFGASGVVRVTEVT